MESDASSRFYVRNPSLSRRGLPWKMEFPKIPDLVATSSRRPASPPQLPTRNLSPPILRGFSLGHLYKYSVALQKYLAALQGDIQRMYISKYLSHISRYQILRRIKAMYKIVRKTFATERKRARYMLVLYKEDGITQRTRELLDESLEQDNLIVHSFPRSHSIVHEMAIATAGAVVRPPEDTLRTKLAMLAMEQVNNRNNTDRYQRLPRIHPEMLGIPRLPVQYETREVDLQSIRDALGVLPRETGLLARVRRFFSCCRRPELTIGPAPAPAPTPEIASTLSGVGELPGIPWTMSDRTTSLFSCGLLREGFSVRQRRARAAILRAAFGSTLDVRSSLSETE